MTSGDKARGFAERVRRFFWLPRGASRRAAPVMPLARVWVAFVAVAAGAAAVGWGDMVVVLIFVGTVSALTDDVADGVRYRWPACVVGLLAGWGAGQLVRAGTPAPADPDWVDYPALAVGSLVAFVVFAAITRLPVARRG
ncbi:hypothetical protein [Streptomyces sp. NBC_01236]|uniref:hypothetical protein n=1 Tax=Streptomyces sp. NBC_01236 TaxID=2903789 RepID=UPI002E0EC112|nr:hypothetical protein OG324_34460 [Streptomyces sp. NBC_01236]